jgi:hypothetical protein
VFRLLSFTGQFHWRLDRRYDGLAPDYSEPTLILFAKLLLTLNHELYMSHARTPFNILKLHPELQPLGKDFINRSLEYVEEKVFQIRFTDLGILQYGAWITDSLQLYHMVPGEAQQKLQDICNLGPLTNLGRYRHCVTEASSSQTRGRRVFLLTGTRLTFIPNLGQNKLASFEADLVRFHDTMATRGSVRSGR